MMSLTRKVVCLFILFLCVNAQMHENVNDTSNELEVYSQSKVLSRRKRFIIFPEGSSLQLVFCLTFPTLFVIGDIFLYGYTAALAWELPQDPYSPFMHHADPLHRRVDSKADSKSIYYTDYDGKVLFKKPYHRRPIVNPAFAKRSIADDPKAAEFEKGTSEFKIDRAQMHALQQKRDFLKSEHMDDQSVEYHRTSRASLYEKIEVLLKAMGVDGRQCMLKALCQVGQTEKQAQSSFLQEILRAVFTVPRGKGYQQDYHKDYDAAYIASGECDLLYPDCTDPLSEPGLSSFA